MQITPSWRKGLAALASAPDGTLTFQELREAMGLTMRGSHRVRQAMMEAHLIAREQSQRDRRHAYDGRPKVTITFSGMQAIKEGA